jgi:hypothetical protein
VTSYWATIEYLDNQGAAIVELTDAVTGQWAGTGRIETRSGGRADLYEAGYRGASLSAQSKDGRLDRFTEYRLRENEDDR